MDHSPIKVEAPAILEQVKEKNIFFVLSTGRSGTKTIAESLSGLPDCLCLHEPAPQLILESSAYRYGRLEDEKLRQFLLQTRQPVVNGKIYGESNQTLSLIVPVLKKSFPNAKFIWLIRNGLDVVSSIFARQWYTGHSANHDRYEDCPPLEKAWIDGRIMGDLCGDVPFAKWKKMDPFARCCWYWAYINRTIEKDLSDYCQVGNYRKLKLEKFDQGLPEIAKWLGFGQTFNQKTGSYNRAHYKLYPWQKWTLEERKTFLYWCGPLMDRLYPDWRILNQGFFDDLNYTPKPITASAVTYPKSQTIPKEDNSTNAKSEELNIYFTPQIKSHPKISVYITSYNQKKYLIEAIESVLAQSLKAHEIIIVDDCSNDGSRELIAKYAQQYPNLIFPIYHTKNFGVVQTRLDALNAVTGDFVTYVDGDDRFLPEKLEHEFEILAEHPNAQIAFSNNYYINPAGQPIGRWVEEEKPPQGLIFKETFGRRFPKNSLFRMELVNYQAWKAVGFHDPAITIYEDFDMRIRMTKHFQAAFCDQPLSEIRMHDKGLSNLEAKQHLASLDFIFHKNRHLLDDLTESDREIAKNGFYDFVNNISRIAANQLAQKHIRKNQNSEKHLHNAIITRSKTDQTNGQNELGSNLIFLISQPRAGSTLFQRVLAGHPEIHTTAEPWIMLHPLYALKENGIIAEYRADLAQQGLVDFLGQVPEGIELYKTALRDFASTLYNRALESSGKRFFLDKTPRYYHIILELYSIFPEAHFIFLLRNPIAVLSSVLKTWYGNRVAGLQIQTLIDLVKGPVRLLDGIKKLKEKAIVVEYESLVQSPETVMLRVCNRIGIPFYEDMLNYGQQPKPKGRFGDSVGIYKHQRPVADNIDKWLKNISSPELTKFSNQYLEALGSDIVSKMGYNFNGLKQKLNSQRPIDNTLQTNLEKLNLLNKEEPFISVITPSLNQGQFIEQTIQSVLKQNYLNFEHIIIDGGSTDRTVEILKQYPHLKWISEKDNGQSHALNKGLKKAKGDIIAWINSDDWYEAGAFKIIADYFNQNPNKNIVMGDCNLVNEEGKIFDTVINNERSFEELKKYWVGRAIPTQPAIFFRRKLLDTYGYADQDLNYAMDYDLWMRFAQRNHFYHIDEKVANYRFHQGAKGGDQNWNKFVPEWKKISQKYAKLLGFSSVISVIIPCYNYGKYLREAVESVIGQTYQNYEIIIINDGSTDNTKEVAESLIAKYPNFAIRLINQKNSGQPAISRNRGIFEANGEYILCLDADDMLQPTMLEKCLNVLERDRNIAIAYTDRQDFYGVNQIVRAKNYDFSQLKYANHISYCALFRKEVWDKIGGYRTNIKGCEDWDFWVAAGAKGYFGRRIPEPLFKYRRHDTGVFQEVLENYDRKFAQVILNNQEVYDDSDINRAAALLGNKAEIESDVCPFVSIVVPTFNRPEMLQEALKSILNQSYQNFEIVVVNDGGEDVSELVNTLQDTRIKYISHGKNMGLAAARNTGIRNASGEYIALLDDDDIFYAEHLQTAVDMLSKEVPVIYTDAVRATYERCGDRYKLIKKNVPYSIDFDRNKLLVGNISPVNCFVFDKSLAVKAGLFDETLSTLEDWDFWIRLSSLTCFTHIPKSTVQVNWRSDGTTMTSLLGAEFGKNRQKIYDKYQAEINKIPNIEEILNEFKKIWAQDWQGESSLTSIIILTCNQLQYTKKCIESILQNTDGPYELIIVDNGSTDGTVEFLESEISKKGDEVRIKIIKNDENKGFAGGNNQGMAAASGDYILLMNNDVVVTPGWLVRMLSCAEKRPDIGIVGPRSNYVSGPQLVEGVDYDTHTLKGLAEFSDKFADDHAGQTQQVLRVVGFCMLIKRAVVDKIGAMDDRYGLGNFEDDDFSLRAAIAGFQSWIARDCFVHHFGHRTFIGEKVDLSKSLQKNWGIFKEKWGLPVDKPYGSPYSISEMKHTRFDPSIHYYPLGNERAAMDKSNNDFESVEARYSAILANLDSKPSQEVIEDLQRLVESYPDFALAYNDLGVLYYSCGNKEKALECYERAVQLDPDNSNFNKNLADFYFVEMGRIEEALQIYVKILKLNPQDIETLLITGHICVALHQFEDAKVFYRRVLELEPQNKAAQSNLNKLDKMDPTTPELKSPEKMYQEIQPFLNNGDPHKAISLLEKLLQSYPDFALAYNDLGVLYYHTGDKEKARHHYGRAVELMPDNINFQKNLADFLFVEQGRVEEALQIYVNILATHPDDVETLLITGHICVSLKKFDDAIEFYQRVLALAPDNEDAAKNLQALMNRKAERLAAKLDSMNDVDASSAENDSTDLNPQELETRDTGSESIVSIVLRLDGIENRIKECLKSIQEHTQEPHELLLVDREATKGMLKWAQQLIKDKENYHIIECARPDSWAESINRAIQKAAGEIIVLMHNDVVVPEGWLKAFEMCIKLERNIGVVGPISNRAIGIQQLMHSDESDRLEFESTATAFRDQNQFRRVAAHKLSDFCLAFRRDLPDKIGYFDEQFVSEEVIVEDFCSRSVSGGYQNLIAADTYVYHYDRHKVKKNDTKKHPAPGEDQTKFREKWNGNQNPEGKAFQTVSFLAKANELSQKGQIDQAVEILLNAIGIQPEEKCPYLELAEILLAAKRFQDAKEALNEMPLEDGNPEIKKLLLLGYAEEGLQNFEEARACIEQVLAINPKHAPGLNLKGILAYRNNNRNSAEKYFKRAIESDPGYGEPYTNLAMLKLEAEQPAEALEFFEKGFILSPSDLDVATNYHAFIEGLGDFARAENIARQAADLYPSNQKIKYMLIDFLVQQGKYEMAMPEIEDAIIKFGIDDGILAAALKVREKLGPMTVKSSSKKVPVSLCMIIKDEEKYLARCLASVKPIVDEMIVVDTGSSDRSKDIAITLGAQVYDYDWNNDYAAARNFSISKASGEWILIMDGDEVISPLDYDHFNKMVAKKPKAPVAYSITTRNYNKLANIVGWMPNDGEYPDEEAAIGWLPSEKVRLFYGKDRIRFEGAVHELVDPVLIRNGIEIKKCSIPVHHYGRLDKEKLERKGEIYFDIGHKKLSEKGEDVNALRELAIQATILEKNQEAFELWQRLLALDPEPKLAAIVYVNLGTIYCRLAKFDDALDAAKRAVECAPDLKEAQYNLAMAELHCGNAQNTISILESLLKGFPDYPPAQFILSAAYCCAGQKEKGFDGIRKLKNTPLGAHLEMPCVELAQSLLAAKKAQFSLWVLGTAIECDIVNKEILDLFNKCIEMNNQVQNLSKISPTGPTGRQLALFEDLPQ